MVSQASQGLPATHYDVTARFLEPAGFSWLGPRSAASTCPGSNSPNLFR